MRYFGLVISIDPDTNRCAVRLSDGRIYSDVGYSFPFFSFRDKTGVVYLPKEGQQVLVDVINNQAYIAGFILPAGFRYNMPLSPGDFGLFGTPDSYILFSVAGAIVVRAGPDCGMNFFPDLSMIELFSNRFRWATSLGEMKVDIDRYGAKLDINFEDIPTAVPGSDIISMKVSSLEVPLFELNLSRTGQLNLKLFNMIEVNMDGVTATVNMKLLNFVLDAVNIQLGGQTAVIPAVLSTPLINLLTQLCSAITTLAGAVTSLNQSAAATATAIANTVLAQLSTIVSKKVKLE